MLHLPASLWPNVLSYLQPYDYQNVRCICRAMRSIGSEHGHERALYRAWTGDCAQRDDYRAALREIAQHEKYKTDRQTWTRVMGKSGVIGSGILALVGADATFKIVKQHLLVLNAIRTPCNIVRSVIERIVRDTSDGSLVYSYQTIIEYIINGIRHHAVYPLGGIDDEVIHFVDAEAIQRRFPVGAGHAYVWRSYTFLIRMYEFSPYLQAIIVALAFFFMCSIIKSGLSRTETQVFVHNYRQLLPHFASTEYELRCFEILDSRGVGRKSQVVLHTASVIALLLLGFAPLLHYLFAARINNQYAMGSPLCMALLVAAFTHAIRKLRAARILNSVLEEARVFCEEGSAFHMNTAATLHTILNMKPSFIDSGRPVRVLSVTTTFQCIERYIVYVERDGRPSVHERVVYTDRQVSNQQLDLHLMNGKAIVTTRHVLPAMHGSVRASNELTWPKNYWVLIVTVDVEGIASDQRAIVVFVAS